MIRPILSYALTGLILLSQMGLPLHMHYCKGMLESISVFISSGCNDHEEIANLPACCRKDTASNCSQNEGQCCDDQVKVLLQDFDSIAPHIDKADNAVAIPKSTSFPGIQISELRTPEFASGHNADSGPPIYILLGSLIFYA